MLIPEKFKKILEKNTELYSEVLSVMSLFKPILDDNKLFFFEEFTDHGIKHIESVLASAEFIITDESFELLTPGDIAVLIFSIILHDIGMHTEFSTFVALINGEYDSSKTFIDEKTWSELWQDYLAEAKRFSTQQKRNILGDENCLFREPDLSKKDNLNGIDKKLIGEFIRRHHARLAHEIAFCGIIGANSKKIEFGVNLPKLYREMAGIVARSHGMNLRSTFPYLQKIAVNSWHHPNGVSVVFLMVVLRIADYIQIDSSRVSTFLLRLKTFSSPISISEHDTHLAIESINFIQQDSERFDVLCSPANSKMLVKLKALFLDIQRELDVSWAVLGEVYGFISTKKPRIKFRRITSNLEDKNYLDNLSFVPQKISFAVSNELSKLLVAPLYGNRSTFGVRELIQNAVDACRERAHLEKHGYEPMVKVSITELASGDSLFEIIDNGKGMDLDEITHYFLAVGVSFRKSLTWKKSFIDESGKTIVNRNGKFGIGVLASFLIGEELTIETKRYNSKISYKFKTTLDTDNIDILRFSDENAFVGTKISVVMPNTRREELMKDSNKWTDWYLGESPDVQYMVDRKTIQKGFKIEKHLFNCFDTELFKNICWSYDVVDKTGRYASEKNPTIIACNDIIISKKSFSTKFSYKKDSKSNYVIESMPSFIFNDPEGLFPIRLDRNDIDCDRIPFENELIFDVSRCFIAKILTLKIDPSQKLSKHSIPNTNASVVFHKSGFSFNIDYFAKKMERSNYRLIRCISRASSVTSDLLENDSCLVLLESTNRLNLSYSEGYVAPDVGGRVCLRKTDYENFFRSEKNRITKNAKNNHVIEYEDNNYVIYRIYRYEPTSVILNEKGLDLIKKHESNLLSIQEVPFSYMKNGYDRVEREYVKSDEILSEQLNKYIGDNIIIPYDMELRKKVFQKAFSELIKFFR